MLNLYNVNHIIRKLWLNEPFNKVLLEFIKNQFFNLNASSNQLNDFLNDLTNGDLEMLKDLQLTFGATLVGKNSSKQIIVLDGSSNGKSTFLLLLSHLMGHRYNEENFDYGDSECYQNAYIVMFSEPDQPLIIPMLNELSLKFTMVICTNQFYMPVDTILINRFKKLTFKTTYINHGNNYIPVTGKKRKIINYFDLISSDHLLASLLNFLLQGCKESLN